MATAYALGPFRLDADNDVLFRGTDPVALGRRAVALLRALIERPGALVSKDKLINAAWPGQAVEDSNLTVQIAALRRTLSEAPGGDRWKVPPAFETASNWSATQAPRRPIWADAADVLRSSVLT